MEDMRNSISNVNFKDPCSKRNLSSGVFIKIPKSLIEKMTHLEENTHSKQWTLVETRKKLKHQDTNETSNKVKMIDQFLVLNLIKRQFFYLANNIINCRITLQ